MMGGEQWIPLNLMLVLCQLSFAPELFIPAAVAGLSNQMHRNQLLALLVYFGFGIILYFATLIVVFTFFIPQLPFLLIRCQMI
jgi:hypothetical protein